MRAWEVTVGRHTPPHYGAVPKFLDRFASFYTSNDILPTHHLIALAAAHHRLAWIHPFADGNGRITRLFSHACLVRGKVDSHGLWSLSRGLARQRQDYYTYLSNADERRWNDVDDRGNLSDRHLAEFCRFFLQTLLDQILFMRSLLQLDSLGTRIERYLQFEALHIGPPRESLSRLLRAAVHESPVERGRVKEIVGLGETAARKIIRLALTEKLLDAPTPKGPLSIVFSAQTLEYYFPKLYQDLPMA